MRKKSTPEHSPDDILSDKTGLDRLVFFSDAVFAIAATLLALEIKLPADAATLSDSGMRQALLALWPAYLGYLISFAVTGLTWLRHHRRFHYIIAYDRLLLLLNLVMLMVAAFMPFATAVVSTNAGQTATVFYAAVIALFGFSSALVWWYAAYHKRLVTSNLDHVTRRRELLRALVTPVVFAFSIGVAYLAPGAARYTWLLSIAGFWL